MELRALELGLLLSALRHEAATGPDDGVTARVQMDARWIGEGLGKYVGAPMQLGPWGFVACCFCVLRSAWVMLGALHNCTLGCVLFKLR